MWCLFRFLPIMIGDLVDSTLKQWHCFLKLWNIVQICTATAIRKDDVPYLKLLIEEHHNLFKEVHPAASIIPKLHYLVHVPDDIIRYYTMKLLLVWLSSCMYNMEVDVHDIYFRWNYMYSVHCNCNKLVGKNLTVS